MSAVLRAGLVGFGKIAREAHLPAIARTKSGRPKRL